MKVLVCISCVPDTTAKIQFTNNNTQLDTNGLSWVIGPYEDFALARAVELKEAGAATSVTVINVGTANNDAVIRKALAIGADDAVRIDAVPADAYFVAAQIAHYAKDKGYDLILTGKESTDYNNGVMHSYLGTLLGITSLSPVSKLNVSNGKAQIQLETDGGHLQAEAALPLVLGCQEPIAEWRIPNMRGIMSAKLKPLQVITPQDVTANTATMQYELPPARGACKFVEPAQLMNLLKTEAKVL